MPSESAIEQLKRNWESDPIWDLWDTEGFEEHKEELKAYQEECEAEWKRQREKKERVIDEKAENLGIKGLYRLILQNKELIKRHDRAINLLSEGKSYEAYRALIGHDV